jgi:hypothetical protein
VQLNDREDRPDDRQLGEERLPAEADVIDDIPGHVELQGHNYGKNDERTPRPRFPSAIHFPTLSDLTFTLTKNEQSNNKFSDLNGHLQLELFAEADSASPVEECTG